ncbi:MAG: InlB B-repeat-containing protein, partial [Clostridiales Family XIII bacterium]|nr:InlB B-repeat-containing protein [Clostridiales Family XIII bacterium]
KLYYGINTYTVIFTDGYGQTLKTQTVEYGAAASAPQAPAHSGYTFGGWDQSFGSVTEDLTVAATWTENPVQPGQGTSGGNASGNTSGGAASGGTTPGSAAQPTEEENYYTITFIDEDGAVLRTESVREGESATLPADPARAGYAFTGWDRGADAWTDVHADAVIKAQYAAEDETVVTPPSTIPSSQTPLAVTDIKAAAREQGIPLIGGLPLFAPKGADGSAWGDTWPLLNGIFALMGLLLILAFLLAWRRKARRLAGGEAGKGHTGLSWLIASIACAAVSITAFLVIEDMSASNSVLADKWLGLSAALLIASALAGAFSLRSPKGAGDGKYLS